MAINSQASLVPSLVLASFPGPEHLSLAVQNSCEFCTASDKHAGPENEASLVPRPL